MNQPVQRGKVYVVGAGPGDPGLITLRGVECLRRADVVLYDYLVNPRVLEHARSDAEQVCLGRHGEGRILPQEEVEARLVAEARAGKTVVRLKGGDPAVFARSAEETETLAAAGIEFEIIPGVTAALAAGSYAGIPVTHRELASAVALVTGQEGEGKAAELDYAALAGFPGTLVFYMGVTTVEQWTAALMAAGKPHDTPAAVVRRCSWPDQLTVRCTLGGVAREMQQRKLRPPVIVIVGDVAGLPETLSWFERRPLFGLRVMVTRPAHQAEGLRGPLEELGADVILQPAIEIAEPLDWSPVDAAIGHLERFDWVVFSSTNGVQFFLNRIVQAGGDMRCLGRAKLAVVGPGTAEELARYHLKADVQPEEFRAEALAAALRSNAAGQRFLLIRASRGREVLAEELRAAGGEVTQVVAYQSVDAPVRDEVRRTLASGGIHWITVTSSAIARSLVAMFGEDLRRAKLASISPITSQTLRELGFEPAVEATEYTMPGVVQAILRAGERGASAS
jgi:uroporphyrinogen III methyltransferase/synthase